MNKMPHARCQCDESCENPPLKGEAFCSQHMNFCRRLAPLSGSEPAYEPDKWNLDKAIRHTHNCFMYAYNIIAPSQIKACKEDPKCDIPFFQPGAVSKFPKFNNIDDKTCPNLIIRQMGDNPTKILPSDFESKCPTSYNKIALVIDADQDYHFLRQDRPEGSSKIGYFSQKSGEMPVTNLDSLGHKIFDVQLANHNYTSIYRKENLNYDKFCGYFCIPSAGPFYMRIGGRRLTKKKRKVSRR